MSTRALRKLHGGQDLDDLSKVTPEAEPELNTDSDSSHSHTDEINAQQPEVAGDNIDKDSAHNHENRNTKSNKKNKLVNPFDLLNEEDTQDLPSVTTTEDPGDKNTADHGKQNGAKKKKKKKTKKKKRENKDESTSAAKNDTEDEIDASIREVNRMLGEIPNRSDVVNGAASHNDNLDFKDLLNVEHRHLNPDNEMRRIFGSRVVQTDQNRQPNRRHNRVVRKTTWLVQPKNTWPHLGKTGLSMNSVETTPKGQCFAFEHNREYQKVQFQFVDAVESMDAQNIINMANAHPYHIDTLLQCSDICKMSDDVQMAADFIERALYVSECAFHVLFSLTQGIARLEYKRRENRAFFIAIFRHINFIGKRGCYRTALEFSKLLLSLDPDDDPLCVLLMIDFFAIRSEHYSFLIKMYEEWEAHKNLSQLPNFAFSVPLAMFYKAKQANDDLSMADEMMQKALIMFPSILHVLLDKCSVVPDGAVSSHPFFGPASQLDQPKALEQLLSLYVGRNFSCWKDPDVVVWLEGNVRQVLSRVDNKDPIVEEYRTKRMSRYQGTPRNILRHIIMSEVKEATAALPPDMASTPVLSYDPLPPSNTTVSYSRPERPRRFHHSGSPLSMFFQSLLPNFNPQELAPEDQGAVGGEGQNFRQGVVQVMDAMRDLLNNIRPVPPPVENEGQNPHNEENVDDQEFD